MRIMYSTINTFNDSHFSSRWCSNNENNSLFRVVDCLCNIANQIIIILSMVAERIFKVEP